MCTLALKPKVLLFDGATSALDPERVGEVLVVIAELARSGITLVIVTHEIGFAREVAGRIIFMEQGCVVERGPPEQILDRPPHRRFPRLRALGPSEIDASDATAPAPFRSGSGQASPDLGHPQFKDNIMTTTRRSLLAFTLAALLPLPALAVE